MNILQKKHTDWPWPLSYVPRAWTAIKSDVPPRTLAGEDTDVPAPGRFTLQVCKYGFMFSLQTKRGWLVRVGSFRYDYCDKYYEIFTLTLKRHSV